MIPIHQTIFPPEGVITKDEIEALPGPQRGNCLQACFASLFELPLEEVPHFVSYSQDEWWGVLEGWLAERNLGVVWGPLDFEAGQGWAPLGVDVIVSGKSPRGEFNHVVIFRDWALAHDPHPSGTGLDGTPKGVYHLYPLHPERLPKIGGVSPDAD